MLTGILSLLTFFRLQSGVLPHPPGGICSPASAFSLHFSQGGAEGEKGRMLVKNESPCEEVGLVPAQPSCLLVQIPWKYSKPLILRVSLILENHPKYFRQFGYYIKCM